MKEVKIKIPDGFELVQIGEGKWEQRKKETPPKTWEEFCKTHPIKDDEYFLAPGTDDGIQAIGTLPDFPRNREVQYKDILPNKETAEAFLALMQLIQLRNCYNGGWEPDWEDSEERKYVIVINENKIESSYLSTTSCPLAFRTEERRDLFIKNFRDLIEIAKPLL